MIDRRALIGGGALLVAAGTGLAVWRSGWLSGPATPDDSIAVRPLQNLSEDPGQDYFSEGLTDEIRLALSRNARLRVLAPMRPNDVVASISCAASSPPMAKRTSPPGSGRSPSPRAGRRAP